MESRVAGCDEKLRWAVVAVMQSLRTFGQTCSIHTLAAVGIHVGVREAETGQPFVRVKTIKKKNGVDGIRCTYQWGCIPFRLRELMWVHHVTGIENLNTSAAVELTHEDQRTGNNALPVLQRNECGFLKEWEGRFGSG